jgi:hypothetical protein
MPQTTYKLSIGEWGPATWHALHAITLTFPVEPTIADRKRYATFFNVVGTVLPCVQCRNHFTAAVLTTPVDTASRGALARWLHAIHNDVNVRTGKQPVEFADFVHEYVPAGSGQARLAMAAPKQQAVAEEFNTDLFIGITLGVLGVAVVAGIMVLFGRRRRHVDRNQ